MNDPLSIGLGANGNGFAGASDALAHHELLERRNGTIECHASLIQCNANGEPAIPHDGGVDGSVAGTPHTLQHEYARKALKTGLELGQQLGTNPCQFGLIGSSGAGTDIAAARRRFAIAAERACRVDRIQRVGYKGYIPLASVMADTVPFGPCDPAMEALIVEGLDEREGTVQGPLRAENRERNRDTLNKLIASHAGSLGVTLVTSNEAAFRSFAGLTIENWVK